MRLFGETTDTSAWDLRLTRTGHVIGGGTLVPIGSLARGQTKTVTFFITPKRAGTQLLAGCNVETTRDETLNQPSSDRAGDFGADLRLKATAATPSPTPSASSVTSSPVAARPLATTGSATAQLTAFGAVLLAGGAVLLLLLRRRPESAHR